MKALIPILMIVIGGLLFLRSCSKREERKAAEASEETESASFGARIASGLVGGARRESSSVEAPTVTQSYRFKHRALPTTFTELRQQGGSQSDLRVLLDEPTATVVFVGPLDQVVRLRAAAEALDVQPHTAYCKAWVFWVSSSTGKGFDVLAEFGAPRETAYGRINGPIALGVISLDKLTLRMQFLAEVQEIVVLQTPQLRFLHGKPSTISTGAQVPVPVATTNQGVTQTTVDFKDVGLELSLTPVFHEKDFLTLGVAQKNEFIQREVQLGSATVPEIASQRLDSSVHLRIGEVVLLGGVETYLSRKTKGFLSKETVRETGYLYVLLATYRAEAKAVPVDDTVPRWEEIRRKVEETLEADEGAPTVPLLPKKGSLDETLEKFFNSSGVQPSGMK